MNEQTWIFIETETGETKTRTRGNRRWQRHRDRRRERTRQRETGTRRTTEIKKKYELYTPRFRESGGVLMLEREKRSKVGHIPGQEASLLLSCPC